MVDFSPICTYKHAITTCQSKTTSKCAPILSQRLPNSLLTKGECKRKHPLSHSTTFAWPRADGGTPPAPRSAGAQPRSCPGARRGAARRGPSSRLTAGWGHRATEPYKGGASGSAPEWRGGHAPPRRVTLPSPLQRRERRVTRCRRSSGSISQRRCWVSPSPARW